MKDSPPRSLRNRAIVASAIGCLAATYVAAYRVGHATSADFDGIWLATQAMLHGADPYAYVETQYTFPLYYPLTAGIVGLPFAWLGRDAASILFSGIGAGVLAFAVTRESWNGLILLANYPMLEATIHSQWTPLLTASAMLPALAWIAVAKPTTGAGIVAGYIARMVRGRTFILNASATLAVLGMSLAAWSSWPTEWYATASAARQYVPLVRRPFGALLLLVLLRWRRPEARMIAALALVPQTAAQYEALPLILVLSSTNEAMIFAVLSFFAMLFGEASFTTNPAAFAEVMAHNASVNLLWLYLPAMALTLRRPNIGGLPTSIERVAARLPSWLAGSASMTA